jgi:hypothetical protein
MTVTPNYDDADNGFPDIEIRTELAGILVGAF